MNVIIMIEYHLYRLRLMDINDNASSCDEWSLFILISYLYCF